MEEKKNNTKLKELILYVAKRCEDYNLFGIVKLNKILFFADTNAWLRTGESITGTQYQKLQFGPVPKDMEKVISELVAAKAAAVTERDMPDFTTQRRVFALAKPKLDAFTAEQISIVDEVLQWARSLPAAELSEISHDSVGWEVARMGEEIPFATALIPSRPIPLTQSEIQYGLSLTAS